jgi:transposase-like protein
VEEFKAERVLSRDVELRSNAYLDNLIEQDHRRRRRELALCAAYLSLKNRELQISY